MSETIAFRGTGMMHGGYAHVACDDLDRAAVELLLASWFAWLGDHSRITIAPAGEAQSAELRIRRWKTRRDLVLFRWRNADETRESFNRVHESFEADHARFEIEQTPKTKKPRALVITLDADDVFSPAGAVGLANRAFAAAGLAGWTRYDLTCAGPVLRKGTRPCPLIPQTRGYQFGNSIGRVIGRGIWWIRRAVEWGRGRD
jgi:hypothetical protein